MEKKIQNTEDKVQKGQKDLDAEILLKARRETLDAQKEKESFSWLTDHSRNFLEAGYLAPGISPEQRIREIAERAEDILGIEGYANKFYNYMSEGFFSLASPVWSNFGKERGLPISCFGSNVSDDMGNILYTQSEVGMMSKLGGGTSGFFGNIRHRGAPVKNNGKA